MQGQLYIGMATAMLCLYQISNIETVFAAPLEDCSQICAEDIELPAIVSSEVLPNGANVRLVTSGGVVRNGSLEQPLPDPIFNTQINRTIENLWRFNVASGSENDLQVDYQLVSGNNESDKLNHPTYTDSKIAVSITEIQPKVISTDPDTQTVLVEGGAIFTLNLSDLKVSGEHSGTLTITITEP
ncbi:MAG: hypothetical protein KME28_03820 [Pelatocladus maniniholoensis HA4357-MV3]|jgi:hypothetical protein|uniref:Uncharacterized protein n=1 Tax=Pelatocladus maniniholoensis HA4357-MV3 TaxID=1117104 RepID=A0A9E3H6B1_9NOST|nr:hypothetical protein [Pelatocladus maniniholoensis HA4357-MV3]BAZ65518.1 hypothetical protein NIES4106_02570 [Fischerella sp. NIES-4106]